MPRRGKFGRLVDQFVATVDEMGGAVDSRVVAEELQARIDAIAVNLGVTKQTVLRSYIPDDWGRQVAAEMMTETADGK